MKKNFVLRSLLAILLLTVGFVGYSQTTVEKSTFTATSAAIDNVISYTTAKGGGTSDPAVNDGQIRLYQNSAGTGGGTITITAADGYVLNSVKIGSGMNTTIAYTIGESTTKSANASLSKNATYTVSEIEDNSITFYCMGKDKNSRLYVNYLGVTYSTVGGGGGEDDTTPMLEADVDALEFKTAPGTTTAAQTIELKTNEYTGAVSYACDNAAFTVTNNGNIYDVTFAAPAAEGTTTGKLTFSANGVEDVTVALTGVSTNSTTDVLNRAYTGVTSTTYKDWVYEAASGAEYKGQSAGGNDAIQLRSDKNNSGIVTTTSGGIVKSVTVTWNDATKPERVMDVYGKNTPYASAADLYSTSTQGTKLGSIAFGESTLTVVGEYEYIGLRSQSGAMYVTDVTIEWYVPYEENVTSNNCYAVVVGNEWDEPEGCWYAAKFINKNTDAYTWATVCDVDNNYNGYIFYLAAGNTPVMRAKAEDAGYTYTHIEFVQLPASVDVPANIQEIDLTGVDYKTTGEIYYDKAYSTTYSIANGEWLAIGTGVEGVEVANGIAYANGVVTAEGAIEVYNIGGAVVARGNNNVDLNGLNGGVYIVRCGEGAIKVVR